jgi:DNA-binding MarR family transcriptional regulator
MKPPSQGGFLVSKVHRLAGRVFTRMLASHGIAINSAQGRILFVLWQEDRIPTGELARRTGLRKSTLTAMLDRLEAMGHIARLRNESDRRQVVIARTEKDRSLELQYVEVSREMTRLFYSGFDAKEIVAFESFLQRILGNLVRAERRGDVTTREAQ